MREAFAERQRVGLADKDRIGVADAARACGGSSRDMETYHILRAGHHIAADSVGSSFDIRGDGCVMIAVRDGIGQLVDKNRQLVGSDRAGSVPCQGVMVTVVDNGDILGLVRNILPDKALDYSRSASVGAVEGSDRIAVRSVDGRAVGVGLLRAGSNVGERGY